MYAYDMHHVFFIHSFVGGNLGCLCPHTHTHTHTPRLVHQEGPNGTVKYTDPLCVGISNIWVEGNWRK